MTYTFLQSDSPSIKICGLTTEEHVDVAVASGVDAIGFVFAANSPRLLNRSDADRLLLQLPSEVLPVAVVQDYPNLQDFSDWPGWLQLAGKETAEEAALSPRPLIKAFEWDRQVLLKWDKCDSIEAILVDGSAGGFGETFSTDELVEHMPSISTPIIVAGGLTPENVGDVIRKVQPAAVDVSSGVETSRGAKDSTLICQFVDAVMQARS